MALSNHERIGKALDALKSGLPQFVERELKAAHGKNWWSTIKQITGPGMQMGGTEAAPEWDAGAVLKVLWEGWSDVFGKTLGRAERSLTSELIEVRNKWAHQRAFTTDDAYRALDSMQRLLNAVVCGHYGRSGVGAALRRDRLGLSDNWLRHLQDIREKHAAKLLATEDPVAAADRLCEVNVIEQVVIVCRTTIARDAWERGQHLSVHVWAYGLQDGIIRDLNVTVSDYASAIPAYEAALAELE